MERLLKFLHKLWNRAQPGLKRAFLLPPKVIAVLVPTTMVLCIAALNTQGKHPVLEMLIYLASAYALAVLVAGLGSITEAAARLLHGSRVYRWAQSNTIARLFISDFRFRGELSLYQGLALSTLFAVFKGVTAVLYRSAWLGAVAVYYISFGVTRLLLVRSWRASQKLESEDGRRARELRGSRQCGCLMLAVHSGMMGMAVQLITEEHIIVYPGSVIYITAAYSFYLLTLSIVNLVKFRRLNSPVLSASKALNFAGALMSVFNLENARTSRFSTDVEFRRIMNTAVGLTVCLLELATAVFIIVRSQLSLKKMEEKQSCT